MWQLTIMLIHGNLMCCAVQIYKFIRNTSMSHRFAYLIHGESRDFLDGGATTPNNAAVTEKHIETVEFREKAEKNEWFVSLIQPNRGRFIVSICVYRLCTFCIYSQLYYWMFHFSKPSHISYM